MSEFSVLGAGLAMPAEVDELRALPELRKATTPMLLSLLAAQRAGAGSAKPPGALVLASSHGELDVTVEYLRGLRETGVGRPFLFQSSLHNATTGFLAVRLGIRGPSVSVSARHRGGEDALEAAWLLLQGADPVASVLVVGVECAESPLAQAIQADYPASFRYQPHAGALLLAQPETGARALSLPQFAAGPGESDERYHESNAIARLAAGLSRAPKPDGSIATWTVT